MCTFCVYVYSVTQRVLTGNFIEDQLWHGSKVPGGTPNFCDMDQSFWVPGEVWLQS